MILPWFALNLEATEPPTPPDGPKTIREAIYRLLVDDPAVAALVEDRVHPGGLPQDPVYPCVSQVVAGRFDVTDFDGTADLSTIRVRVSSWSPRLFEAEQLALAVRKAVLNSPGLSGSVSIESAVCENEFDLPERPQSGDDEYLHQIVGEYRFWFRAVPQPEPPPTAFAMAPRVFGGLAPFGSLAPFG